MARERLFRPIPLILLIAAVLIGGISIGIVLHASLLSGATASSTGEAEVRIAATPREDGSVRLGLQQQDADGSWGEVEYPQLSVVPADSEPNRRLYSSALTVSTTADVYTLADSYYDWAIGVGQFLKADPAVPQVWCLLQDVADNEVGHAVCQGVIDGLGEAAIETIRYTDLETALG